MVFPNKKISLLDDPSWSRQEFCLWVLLEQSSQHRLPDFSNYYFIWGSWTFLDTEGFIEIPSFLTSPPLPPPGHSLCWWGSRLRMQVIFLPCHCLTALSYIYFIVPLWWLLRAFVSFCASVKNIYGFYSMRRGRPSAIIEEIQGCQIKAAFCILTGICRYFQAHGGCLSTGYVWQEEVHCLVELGGMQENMRTDMSFPW